MKINPVLKNETKLAVRSFKFTLVIFFYLALLSAGAIFIFYQNFKRAYFSGLELQTIVWLYIGMAVIQAILLMFIVPSLTATAICAEREKQTLDVLLSTKMSPLSIISGKLIASISRVILLIICTMPIYSITFFIGGIDLGNILELSAFFIVTTIFAGSIGVFISTFAKTSKAATAITYGMILFIYLGIMIIALIYFNMTMVRTGNQPKLSIPWFTYLSPAFGFISLLIRQIGSNGFFYFGLNTFNFDYGYIISIAIQLVLSVILVLGASYRLNPLSKKFKIRRKNRIKSKNELKEKAL